MPAAGPPPSPGRVAGAAVSSALPLPTPLANGTAAARAAAVPAAQAAAAAAPRTVPQPIVTPKPLPGAIMPPRASPAAATTVVPRPQSGSAAGARALSAGTMGSGESMASFAGAHPTAERFRNSSRDSTPRRLRQMAPVPQPEPGHILNPQELTRRANSASSAESGSTTLRSTGAISPQPDLCRASHVFPLRATPLTLCLAVCRCTDDRVVAMTGKAPVPAGPICKPGAAVGRAVAVA